MRYSIIVVIACLVLTGCADIVQTRRIVDGKETIHWTTKSQAARMEQEDAFKQQVLDSYRKLPPRPIGETITIRINRVSVDPQLKESYRADDFMNRLLEKFERNRMYQINPRGFVTDVEIDTHVELSKEVGIASGGKLGEYWAVTLMGTVRNRFYPDQPYKLEVSSDIWHNVEAIEEYYRKIDQFIKYQVAPTLPDLTR